MKDLNVILSLILVFILITVIHGCGINQKEGVKVYDTHLEREIDTSRISTAELYKIEKIKYDSIKDKVCKTNQCGHELIECYKDIFDLSASIYMDNFYNKVVNCALELATQGDKQTEILLVNHYDNIYESHKANYQKNIKYFNRKIGQLRSPEAFEVAMKYARHGQWNEKWSDDVGAASHSGLKFIRGVIFPMIKSIDGIDLGSYLINLRNNNPKKYKYVYLMTNGGDAHYAKLIHKDLHRAIMDAWESGKIVLKQYGE